MKTSIIILLLLFTPCFCLSQKLNESFFDTLQKNSTYIVVGEIISIYPGLDLNLSQTWTSLSFKPIDIFPQNLQIDQKIFVEDGKIVNADCIQVRKYFDTNDSTSFPLDKFKNGDTCIIFLKYMYEPKTQRPEAYFSILSDTAVFHYDKTIVEYLAGISWGPYKENKKCKFVNPNNKTSYWCLRLSPDVYTESGLLLEKNTIEHKKSQIINTTTEYKVDGSVEKKSIHISRKVNPILRRKKYPKYQYGFYVKGIIKTYDERGKLTDKIRDKEIVWCGQRFGSKF